MCKADLGVVPHTGVVSGANQVQPLRNLCYLPLPCPSNEGSNGSGLCNVKVLKDKHFSSLSCSCHVWTISYSHAASIIKTCTHPTLSCQHVQYGLPVYRSFTTSLVSVVSDCCCIIIMCWCRLQDLDSHSGINTWTV